VQAEKKSVKKKLPEINPAAFEINLVEVLQI